MAEPTNLLLLADGLIGELREAAILRALAELARLCRPHRSIGRETGAATVPLRPAAIRSVAQTPRVFIHTVAAASPYAMAKHILVPVDGGSQSERALSTALSLAGCFGARVTAFYALPSERGYSYATVPAFVDRSLLSQHTIKEIHDLIGEQARHYLRELVAKHQQAESAPSSVAIGWDCTESDHPDRAILNTAHRLGCDLIVMASHGRRGMEALLLGSETHKVLTHSDLPVLVVPPDGHAAHA